eukprot:551662_1
MYSTVCKFYNPYFQSGCSFGTECNFVHLTKSQYIKHCQLANQQTPPTNNAQRMFTKCMALISKSKYEQSIKILKKLLIDYPLHEQIYIQLAKCYDKLHKNEAFEMHERLIAINPYNPIYHNRYAMYLCRRKDYKAAKKHFLQSISPQLMNNHVSDASAAVTHSLYAHFLFETENNVFRSNHHYEIALTLDDKNTNTNYNYALLLWNMKCPTEAEKYFKKSHLTHPNPRPKNLWNHYEYVKFLKERRNYEEAEKQFIICCRLAGSYSKPAYYNILFEYGLFLVECKCNYDLGLNYLQRSSLHGDNDKYSVAYNYYKNQREESERKQSVDEQSIHSYQSYQSHQSQMEETKHDGLFEENKTDIQQIERHSRSEKIMPTCAIEFRRFLEEKVFVHKNVADVYYDKFAEQSLNDIRYLDILDDETLKEDIGIEHKIHRKMFIKMKTKYLCDCEKFTNWLKDIKMADEYEDSLRFHGIITFDSLYHYVHSSNDLFNIVPNCTKSDAETIWHNTPKMSRNRSQ